MVDPDARTYCSVYFLVSLTGYSFHQAPAMLSAHISRRQFVSEAEVNEQFVRRFFDEVWNQKNEAALEELLAPDCIAYGLPDPDAVLRGPEEFLAIFRLFVGAFPDVQVTVHDVIAAGDRVAVRWTAVGTHLGPHLGFPASGKSISLDGATIGIVHDGKIAQAWNTMDMGHLFDSIRPEPRRT